MHLRSRAKYEHEARQKLFGEDNDEEPVDRDVAVRAQQMKQERIAQEMVALAQSLKQNCLTANSIIKQDTQVAAL